MCCVYIYVLHSLFYYYQQLKSMYKYRRVIIVRYLNKSEDHPLSRPHKVQKITEVDDTIHYYTMNKSREINPSTFTTTWKTKEPTYKSTAKQNAIWEIIRVKFKPDEKRARFSRPIRVFKITSAEVVTYAPYGMKGTARRINPDTFITKWPNGGRTPTPKPLRKYCDETLKKLGYSIEEIRKIRERNFSSKDIKIVSKKLKISSDEARELLSNHKGNKHLVYKIKLGEDYAVKNRATHDIEKGKNRHYRFCNKPKSRDRRKANKNKRRR